MTNRERFGWIGWIVAGIILLLSGILLETTNKYIPVIVRTVSKISIPADTVFIDKPNPIKIDSSHIQTNIVELDSAKKDSILRDYFTLKTYEQVFKDDTSAFIKLTQTVFKNSLQKSKLIYENRIGIKTITTTIDRIIQPKYSILVGATYNKSFYVNAGFKTGTNTFLLGASTNGFQLTYLKSLYSW